MNCFAVRGLGRVHDGLGQGRMGMYRKAYVLECRAHLERDHTFADQ